MKINVFSGGRPGVIAALLLFGAIFFLFRCSPANADDSFISVGASIHNGFTGGVVLTYSERMADKWDLGVKLIGEQSWDNSSVDKNLGFFAQRIVKSPKNRFELGIGGAYFLKTNLLIGCNMLMELSVRWNITERIMLTHRHNSNAGVCEHNRGQDILSIGWRFGK